MHSQERLKAISGSFQLAIFPINVAIIVFLWVFALYTPITENSEKRGVAQNSM